MSALRIETRAPERPLWAYSVEELGSWRLASAAR
jgi:hypothetical protein